MKQLELVSPGESVPIAKESPRCTRCNRKLTNHMAIARGMGQVCYQKQQEYEAKFLIDLFASVCIKATSKSSPSRHGSKNKINRQDR